MKLSQDPPRGSKYPNGRVSTHISNLPFCSGVPMMCHVWGSDDVIPHSE